MKLTQKDFNLFCSECQKWIEKLKLDDWEVNFYFQKYTPNNSISKTSTDSTAKSATITLNTEIDDNITDDIRESAKHEVIHILLAPLSDLGWSRFITSDEIRTAEEGIVRKLEKIL